jgi:spermidine synthase
MSENAIYYEDGELIASTGEVRVYNMDDQLFLEIGPSHTLWTLESEIFDYIEQLGDTPSGDVLEIGLGMGVTSRYLLSCEKVKTLTTIEVNKDVIKVYNKIKELLDDKLKDIINVAPNKKHRIINNDGLRYITHTQRKYDFIFIDNYTIIDEETLPEIEELVKAAAKILNSDGIISGWYDKYTLERFTVRFNDIFGCDCVSEA